MFSLLNWLQGDLKLYEGFCILKIYFIKSGAIPFLTFRYMSQGLQIFLVRCYKFV